MFLVQFLIWTLLFLFLGLHQQSYAYPDFIGYGYSSCMTCHYNGNGGGALSDYGRALFAMEITARDVFPAKMDDEAIGMKSGFLGSREMPWWLRPGVKYRGLWFENSPGSKTAKTEKLYNMQTDLNLNFFIDRNQTNMIVTTLSYTTYPRGFATSTEDKTTFWFLKEYYLRYQLNKIYWLYLGQLDKVYGIRQVDHTLNSRSLLGFGQFDQSQGFVVQAIYPNWELSFNGFLGNQAEKSEFKQKGISISAEHEPEEKIRNGISFLSSQSDVVAWRRFGAHTRLGLAKGSALLAELGFYENKNRGDAAPPAVTGIYSNLETLISLRRGYNLTTVLQYTRADAAVGDPERVSMGIGAMLFPLPRSEFRVSAINGKSFDQGAGAAESWQLQSQFHLSW